VSAASKRPDAAPAGDVERRRRVLILAPYPPRLDGAHGGSRAVAQLVLALAARNRVALAYLRAGDEPPLDDELTRACELVVEGARGGSSASSVWPLAPATLLAMVPRLLAGCPLWVAARWRADFDARVRALVDRWRPDVIEGESSVMGQYLTRSMARSARLVVTFHEAAALAAAERLPAAGLAGAFWRREARRWRRFERSVLSRVDAAVAFTARDAESLRAIGPAAGGASIEVIPLGIPAGVAASPPSPPPAARRIVFVGNFAHPPNTDAARYLIEEIFPPLRRRFTDAELWIVGAGAPAELLAGGADGVVVTGWVPETHSYLASASVVVAPLRRGGGMRVKVLEAMAAGKAIVATSLAAEGVRVTSGRELLVADDTESFRAAVATLLEQPARCVELGRAARERILADHSWDAAASEYEALYDRLGAAREAAQASHG